MRLSDQFCLEMIKDMQETASDNEVCHPKVIHHEKFGYYRTTTYEYKDCYLTLFKPVNNIDDLSVANYGHLPEVYPNIGIGNYKEQKRIILAGYGVGGCVAINAAYYLALSGLKIERVISYGSPAFLNQLMAERYHRIMNINDNTIRYVLKNDDIARQKNNGFHVGIEKLLKESNGSGHSIEEYLEAFNEV